MEFEINEKPELITLPELTVGHWAAMKSREKGFEVMVYRVNGDQIVLFCCQDSSIGILQLDDIDAPTREWIDLGEMDVTRLILESHK